MLGFKTKGFCHICNRPLYFKVYEADSHIFCRSHLSLYLNNKWEFIKSFEFHAEDNNAARLEDLRAFLFHNNFPTVQNLSYVERNSKIFTVTNLFCLAKHKDEIISILLKNNL